MNIEDKTTLNKLKEFCKDNPNTVGHQISFTFSGSGDDGWDEIDAYDVVFKEFFKNTDKNELASEITGFVPFDWVNDLGGNGSGTLTVVKNGEDIKLKIYMDCCEIIEQSNNHTIEKEL